jgi:hypothetical protein
MSTNNALGRCVLDKQIHPSFDCQQQERAFFRQFSYSLIGAVSILFENALSESPNTHMYVPYIPYLPYIYQLRTIPYIYLNKIR